MDETYTTIRIKRTTKADIEKIAAKHKIDTGEDYDAGQVVDKAIEFLMAVAFPEAEKA